MTVSTAGSGTFTASGIENSGNTTVTVNSLGSGSGNGVSPLCTSGISANNTATVTKTNNTVSAASSTPTLCISTPLTAITHTTTGATGIGTPSNLPAGVSASWSFNIITISGTPTASGTFSYSIPLTGGCGTVNATGTITVRPLFIAGAIATTGQTICYTTVPTTQIGSTTAASGGDNSITYQWQYSTDNTFATGVTTVASNTATYTPTQTLTQTTYYRRQAHDGTCNTAFTSSTIVWTVTVRPQFTAGEIATTGQTICYNTAPSIQIGSTTVASGGDGTTTYQWQYSTDNTFATGVTTVTNNTATYTPNQTLTQTTYYRRQAKDGTCNAAFTNSSGVWAVTVDATKTWVGTSSSTDWDTPANWKCGVVPNSGEDVTFSTAALNDLYLPATSDKTIGNLTNNSDKALVIPTGRTLTIGGTATTTTNSADRIVIKSNVGDANGALIFTQPTLNTNVLATVEYDSKTEKPSPYTNIYTYKWQYMGTPVTGTTPVSAFGAAVSGSKYGPAGSVLIRKYNEAKNEPGDVGDKWDDVDVNTAMTPFAGYEVVQQYSASNPYPFKGTLNVGDFNTGNLGFTSGAYYRGNYIIANSYAAPIDISKLDKVGDANFLNLEKTIYLYNTGSRNDWTANSYGTANIGNPGTYLSVPVNTATTLGVDQIPSLNGFMVRSLKGLQTTDTRQFNFTYLSLKPGGGTTANKPMYIKSVSASEKQTDTWPLLLIDVKGTSGVDRVHLITAPNTTKGFDNGWDGTKLRTQTDAQIYAFANGTDRYQVSTDADLNGTILGFFNGTGETAFTLTFRMKDMQNVYNFLELEDLETGAKTNITDGGTFAFNASALSPESRFRINGTIAPPPPVVIEIPITITYDKSKKLTVNNGSTETGMLSVYDMSGNKVYEAVMPLGLTYYKLKLKKGVYVVKASTASYETFEKIIEL